MVGENMLKMYEYVLHHGEKLTDGLTVNVNARHWQGNVQTTISFLNFPVSYSPHIMPLLTYDPSFLSFQLNIATYLNQIFDESIPDDEDVLVYTPDYLRRLNHILEDTDER